jgi:hypothetical protein
MARQPGSRTQMALAFETVYGTAPASGYRRMPFASTTLGSEQGLLPADLLGYGRDPMAPSRDAINADGEIVVPMDAEALGFWLKAIFGSPTTTGTTPKTHTFQSGAASLPSMAIETQMPDVPRFAMYTGVVADRIQWQMQRGGMLTATVAVVAQGEASAGTTAAGTPTDFTLPLQRFTNFQGTISRNGSALANIVSAQVNYANNLDRIETIRGDGLIAGADPAMASLTGTIEARFADTTLLDQAIAGTPCELAFAWSLGANASFTLTAHAVYLPRARVPIAGPEGVQASFEWQAARAASPARMCTAVLVNTVASY